MAGQALVKNLYPGRYGVAALPGCEPHRARRGMGADQHAGRPEVARLVPARRRAGLLPGIRPGRLSRLDRLRQPEDHQRSALQRHASPACATSAPNGGKLAVQLRGQGQGDGVEAEPHPGPAACTAAAAANRWHSPSATSVWATRTALKSRSRSAIPTAISTSRASRRATGRSRPSTSGTTRSSTASRSRSRWVAATTSAGCARRQGRRNA